VAPPPDRAALEKTGYITVFEAKRIHTQIERAS
jgi:hypothetical protein